MTFKKIRDRLSLHILYTDPTFMFDSSSDQGLHRDTDKRLKSSPFLTQIRTSASRVDTNTAAAPATSAAATPTPPPSSTTAGPATSNSRRAGTAASSAIASTSASTGGRTRAGSIDTIRRPSEASGYLKDAVTLNNSNSYIFYIQRSSDFGTIGTSICCTNPGYIKCPECG